MRGIADLFSRSEKKAEVEKRAEKLEEEKVDAVYDGELQKSYYSDVSIADAESDDEESVYVLEYVVDDTTERTLMEEYDDEVSELQHAYERSRPRGRAGGEYILTADTSDSIRWEDFVGRGHDDDDELSSDSRLLSDVEEDDEFSVFFEREEEEEDSSPGSPPSIPLPPLPTLPTTPAPAEGELKRLSGEALQSVVGYMHRSAGIGKERRKNKGQEFDEEEC